MKRWIFVAAIAAASPAFAGPKEEAKQHLDAAAVAFKENRLEDTLLELNKAYALDPKPELHYSIGQVYVKLDRCDDAILAYQNFLASKPSRERADLANQAIDKCKAQKAAQPPPPTDEKKDVVTTPPPTGPDNEAPPGMETKPPTDASTPTGPTAPVTHADAGPPAWYKDKLGIGLTGGGAVVTIIGLVMLSSAQSKADDASNADTYGDSSSQYDDAKSQRTTSLIVTTVGLAAIGVGVWRFLKVKKQNEEHNVAIVPTADGGMITFSRGF